MKQMLTLEPKSLLKMCLLGTYIMIDFNYYKAHENGIQISYERADDSAANALYLQNLCE